MKRYLAALLILPGGLLIVLTAAALDIVTKIWTGLAELDALVGPVVYGVLGVYRPITPDQWSNAIFAARALIAIANSEQSFDGTPGDTDASQAPGGPSVSPWQIERVNAVRYDWWSPPEGATAGDDQDRAAYAAQPVQGIFAYRWAMRAAAFFKGDVESLANGDLTTALRAWNGGPDYDSSQIGFGGNTVADNTTAYASRSAGIIAGFSA